MKIRIFFRVMFCYVLCQKIFSLLCYVLLCENRKFSCYVMLCVMTWIFSLYKELILGKQRKMRFRIRKKWFSPSNLDTVTAQCDADCLEARNKLSMTSRLHIYKMRFQFRIFLNLAMIHTMSHKIHNYAPQKTKSARKAQKTQVKRKSHKTRIWFYTAKQVFVMFCYVLCSKNFLVVMLCYVLCIT